MNQSKKRLLFSLLISGLVIITVFVGRRVYLDNKQKENLANQRLAAMTLRKEEPNATKVVFTDEGAYPGVGVSWSVRAEVTFGQETFKMILNKDEIEMTIFDNEEESRKFDERNKPGPIKKNQFEVVYSNKEKEILK